MLEVFQKCHTFQLITTAQARKMTSKKITSDQIFGPAIGHTGTLKPRKRDMFPPEI